MKNAQRCPKCECRKLWVMKPAQFPSPESTNTTIPYALAGAIRGKGFMSLTTRVEVGEFEAWICSQCGFTEWYQEPTAANARLSALAGTPGAGVYWVDSTSPAYR